MIIKLLVFIALYCVWVMVALAGTFSVFTVGLPPGDLPFPAVVVYLILILIPVWLFARWFNSEPAWMKQVRDEGKQATATILSVKDTGMIINRTIDVVKVQLRVEPSDEPPFEVGQERRVSLFSGLGDLREGAHVQVKYDPNHKQHVVILSDADPAPDYATTTSSAPSNDSGTVLARNLAELSRLHKNRELSDSEFEAAKKKLLN